MNSVPWTRVGGPKNDYRCTQCEDQYEFFFEPTAADNIITTLFALFLFMVKSPHVSSNEDCLQGWFEFSSPTKLHGMVCSEPAVHVSSQCFDAACEGDAMRSVVPFSVRQFYLCQVSQPVARMSTIA